MKNDLANDLAAHLYERAYGSGSMSIDEAVDMQKAFGPDDDSLRKLMYALFDFEEDIEAWATELVGPPPVQTSKWGPVAEDVEAFHDWLYSAVRKAALTPKES